MRASRYLLRAVQALSAASLAASLTMATPAFAKASAEEKAGARAAAQAGADAFDAGNWRKSLEFFTKSETLLHAPPHVLYMARCEDKLGKLVEAREHYTEIVRESLAPNAPQAFRDAKEAAIRELEAIEPRIPYVSVSVQGAGRGPVEVKMNGKIVPPALVGIPRPLDPGTYEFQGFAEGKQSDTSTIVVKESAKQTVLLLLEDREPRESGVGTNVVVDDPMAKPKAEPAETAQPPADDDGDSVEMDSDGLDPLFIGGRVGVGVGAVGLGMGVVFALDSASKFDESNALCADGCPAGSEATVAALDDDGESATQLSTVGFVVGGLGLAAGGTLLYLSLTADDDGADSAAVVEPTLRPWIGWQSAGVVGTF